MKKFILAIAAAVAGTFGVAASSQAATVTFDLTGPSSYAPSYSFTDGTLGLTVTATNQIPFFKEVSVDASQDANGMGVFGVPLGDPHQIDGQLSTERLYLNFSENVHVTQVVMTLVDKNDDADLTIPGPTTVKYHLADYGSPTATINGADLPAGSFSTLIISNADINLLAKNADNFEVSSISVCYDSARGPVVPLPSSVLGGMGLLVGGGLFRGIRRFKTA